MISNKSPTRRIKTSTHLLSAVNSNKQHRLSLFIDEYAKAVRFYVDYLWHNKITYTVKEEQRIFNLQQDQLNCPSFISTVDIAFSSPLSARALKCAITQSCGIVRAAVDERKHLLYKLSKQREQGKRTRKTLKQLQHTPIRYPKLNNIFPELNSICCQYQATHHLKNFDAVIVLSSLGKSFGKITLPINLNKHSQQLQQQGHQLLPSYLLSKQSIYLRWSKDAVSLKQEGKVVGADQGINTVLSLSDGQATQQDKDGHTLNSILKKIERKKKGSKAFHQALAHRNNFINWSVNQLNLDGIKTIKLETISNFRKGKNVGKFLNYFGEKLIREKLIDRAQQCGVQVIEQSSFYRSQRCSSCGFVCSDNRNGKLFGCKHCSFQADADYNASCNHEQNLPDAKLLLQHHGKQGKFFWKAEGFFSLDGSEFAVPNMKKSNS